MDNQEEVSSEKTGQHTSWSWKIWAEEREGGAPRVWVGVRAGDRRAYRLEGRWSRRSRLALEGASLEEPEAGEQKMGRGTPETEVMWSRGRGARAGGAASP